MAVKGGYDYKFVEVEPSNDCICLICNLVCREAQQVRCCGKISCKGCLESLQKKADNFKCPNCGKDLASNYFDDKRADREINQLQVLCDAMGCDWKGLLQEAHAHHNSCVVECPNKCYKRIKFLQLEDHLKKECPRRQMKCPHCNSMGRYDHITGEHLKTCPDLKISCPNRHCTQQTRMNDMPRHRLSCLKESIHCEYVDMGCSHVCLREEMPRHAAQEVHSHLQLATKTARSLLESNECSRKALTFEISCVSHFIDTKKPWYSPAFYSSPRGYKMRLSVKLTEEITRNSPLSAFRVYVTKASVALQLMPGNYDDILSWPMRKEFTVRLLNQERDENHITKTSSRLHQNPDACSSRVAAGHVSTEFGSCEFELAQLGFELQHALQSLFSLNSKYLEHDTVFFGVKTVNGNSTTKPWLADAL